MTTTQTTIALPAGRADDAAPLPTRCPHCDGLAVWVALSLGYGWQCSARCPTGKAWRKMNAAEKRARWQEAMGTW